MFATNLLSNNQLLLLSKNHVGFITWDKNQSRLKYNMRIDFCYCCNDCKIVSTCMTLICLCVERFFLHQNVSNCQTAINRRQIGSSVTLVGSVRKLVQVKNKALDIDKQNPVGWHLHFCRIELNWIATDKDALILIVIVSEINWVTSFSISLRRAWLTSTLLEIKTDASGLAEF